MNRNLGRCHIGQRPGIYHGEERHNEFFNTWFIPEWTGKYGIY